MIEKIALASASERRAIFLEASKIRKMNASMIEKDFWVCWTLNRIFSDSSLQKLLCFKGGTSLSKVFNVIERFSEDIDLILNCDAILNGRELIQESKNKQNLLNKSLIEDSQKYIATTLKTKIREVIGNICSVDVDDNDKNILNVKYPRGLDDSYLLPFIKLEIGPLASWIPNDNYQIKPYIDCIDELNFDDIIVPTIVAERTFWEKVTILHREHFRSEKHKHPERYSRHYYDLFKMGNSSILNHSLQRLDLLEAVVDFKKRFYPCSWANYDLAKPKTIELMPSEYNLDFLKNDYKKMELMIYGDYPEWNEIIEFLKNLEQIIHNL